ncbi:substrate-binding domain-containing protein [Siculibacillus lacustris]|uniref:substrate-binding domain-containing protein n=1 Tax=Siculibacillus lacustris TaxID=1549641 RepID=UPI0013F1766B|nr:substrate-binding domain-containing protein [Siculibacillus lacustris]
MTEPETPAADDPKTIDQIAAVLGLSRTTVRAVVGGQAERYRIKAETCARVEAYVAEHGVAVNHTARSLKLKRSEAVGLVVPDLANAFFARLTAELEERCSGQRLVLLTASSQEDPDREARAIEGLTARGVDGLVIASCRPADAFRPLRRRGGCAVVMVDRAFPGTPFPAVVGDNEQAARRLTAELLRVGDGRVDFLHASAGLPSIQARLEGFAAAHASAGIGNLAGRLHRIEVDDVAAAARAMAGLITARGRVPEVFMCSSLLVLEGALQAIVAFAGRLPKGVVIGTFDHHPLLDVVPNRILSVRQDERGIAERAFRCLIEQMEGAPALPERHVVPGWLTDHRVEGPAR